MQLRMRPGRDLSLDLSERLELRTGRGGRQRLRRERRTRSERRVRGQHTGPSLHLHLHLTLCLCLRLERHRTARCSGDVSGVAREVRLGLRARERKAEAWLH